MDEEVIFRVGLLTNLIAYFRLLTFHLIVLDSRCKPVSFSTCTLAVFDEAIPILDATEALASTDKFPVESL